MKALEAQALVGRSYAVYQYLKQNIASEKTSIDAGLSSSRKAYCWCHIGSTASSQYYYGYLKEIAGPNWNQQHKKYYPNFAYFISVFFYDDWALVSC